MTLGDAGFRKSPVKMIKAIASRHWLSGAFSARFTLGPYFILDGISEATDNIPLQRHGKGGMDAKKRNVHVHGQV